MTTGIGSLAEIIDGQPGDRGWHSVDEAADWLRAATETDRLAARAAVRQRLAVELDALYNPALKLAVIGTAATAAEALDGVRGHGIHHAELAAEILGLRQVPWVGEFVQRWLERDPAAARRTVDCLVAAGLVPRPTSTGYVAAMWAGLPGLPSGAQIRARLLTAPETTGRDVLTMLDAPGSGEALYTLGCDYHRGIGENTWPWQIALLADEGVVDRAALIDSCLRKLDREASRTECIWFVGMLNHLRVTEDDAAAQAPRLLRLLRAERSSVVSLAQNALLLLVRARRVDPQALLDASASPLARPEKKLVLTQLRMLDHLATTDPAMAPAVAGQARLALDHERADVQDAALKVIGKHADPQALASLDVQAVSPALSATVAGIGLTLPGAAGATAAGTTAADVDRCAALVERLPAQLRERWELDQALAAARAGSFPRLAPPPATFGTVVPPLEDDPAELARLFGELMERDSDPVLVQQALAAAVRTSSLPLAERAALWAPYRRRADRLPMPFYHNRVPPQSWIGGVANCWADGRRLTHLWYDADNRVQTTSEQRAPQSLVEIFQTQAVECTRLMARTPGAVLVAEPTHASGAIDPAILLDRVRRLRSNHPWIDLELAALRLPRGLDAEYWNEVCARNEHAGRSLRGYYDRQQLPPLMPAVGLPDHPTWTVGRSRPVALAETPGEERDPGIWWALTDLDAMFEYRPHRYDSHGLSTYDAFAWDWTSIAPWHHELIAAHLLIPLSRALMPGNNAAPRSPLALDSATGTLGPVGHLALVLALQGASATTRTPAADTWLAAAGDGRLQPGLVADAMLLLHEGGLLQLNRIIDAIRPTVAEPAAGYRTLEALTSAAPGLLAGKARHLHLLFELAAELAARFGCDCVPSTLRAGGETRSTSALAVARRRLAQITSDAPERPAAAVAAIEAWISRLE